MAKTNSRWRSGAVRYSEERKLERTRFARKGDGARRITVDSVGENTYVEGVHEASGWKNGARVRRTTN